MKVYFSCLLLLVILLNVISLSVKRPPPVVFLCSPGPASLANLSNGVDLNPGVSTNNPGTKDMETGYILRRFKWKNKKEESLVTVLRIPEKALRNEIKNFGIIFSMVHPRYIEKQGFRKLGDDYVIDYRGVYQRNLIHFKDITADLVRSAKIEKGMDPLIDFLKFCQQLEYKIPPKYKDGKYIMEFYTPLQCLEKKMGDCDTKSILLAEFLGAAENSQERMAILILRGYGIFHAVLAVKRTPLPGALKLFFHGKGYFVPLEVSFPGWMPGFVNINTLNCLKAGFFKFEELN